jgi:hypothetical protein
MSEAFEALEVYEAPDFVDLDEVYGFSQSCSSGTYNSNCVATCTTGK